MLYVSALNAFLISALLTMSGACSLSQFESARTSPAQLIQAPLAQNEIEELASVRVVHVLNEPFALRRVESDAKKRQMTLEIQNVSDKTVRLVTYGLGVSTLCSEFMYTMVPTPRIGYGDWSLAGVKSTSQINRPLKPHERATIVVVRDKYLSDLLNPKMYGSCPNGHKKPELMLQNVYFDDGTEWRPNQQRTSPSRNQ